jgi:hypothetical protein
MALLLRKQILDKQILLVFGKLNLQVLLGVIMDFYLHTKVQVLQPLQVILAKINQEMEITLHQIIYQQILIHNTHQKIFLDNGINLVKWVDL